ncbi:hypothetical protein CBR_g18833 [Chara braunii]|uniref:Uncharacterized protein n=1 Tax=Chara braunii TaxID=69332 RepID=A0A388KWK8_CHABU|nr:hypothetical protein CBR_g18833 [Chara braunii]|eukprot:GBG74421.1 hypothetical protein CBR_g18833 [Chara braunii]
MKRCDGLWGLRERVLGWFDPEGTTITGEKQKDSQEGEGTSTAGETGSSKGGLKKIVSTLTRALNKNQGYLADAKKKLTFDGANITEFLIDYENLAALLKWSEEEKMDHLGQHVSLGLGRDIMAIIVVSGSWKKSRNEMMRKYLKTEKMATGAELVAVQRKNYATYNDFLRVFTLVALRIPEKGRLDAKLISPVRIHTVEHECWNDKGPAYEFGIAAEVTELLRAKINSFVAEPTASLYANKWFVFRKPNKMLMWIQDLQKLNAVTIRDAGSLPQTDLLAESHAGWSIDSLIDLYSGYDQLPLDARDRPYTAIHTPVGQLQMQVTPMGFTNAVAEAQRGMLAVAGNMFPEKCEPYIDDNPIKGAQNKDEMEVQPGVRKFVWDHLQDIKDLLQRFLVYNITASGPKSIMAVAEVIILRFRCFAEIAEPIRVMIRKGGTMEWTEDREAAVQTLKDLLTSDQVTLAAPCFNDEVGRPFILETDGGPLAVGGVLIQWSEEGRERPIRFESRTLNSAERRYSQFKKEVLAILHCLKTFQAYLFGRRFIMRIDPTNISGVLKNYKPIDLTVGRWIGFIWQLDYKIERISGLRNKADGLSRVCITPDGIEDAEPIDAFLEYEGGTLAVDNEMISPACTPGQLLIQTLEGGTPAVVAELREGPVTTIRRKDEKDSWGETMGPKEELMAMAIEGGRDAVMCLVESWTRKELRYLVSQAQEKRDTNQEGQIFFLVQMYDDVFREINLLLIGNKQPLKVCPKASEEAEKPHPHEPEEREEEYSLIQDSSIDENREEPNEVIDISSEDEAEEVTTPTEEVWARDEDPEDENDKWIREFRVTCNHCFDQWTCIMRHDWALKAQEQLSRGEEITPPTFLTEGALVDLQRTKRRIQREMDARARQAQRKATEQQEDSGRKRD